MDPPHTRCQAAGETAGLIPIPWASREPGRPRGKRGNGGQARFDAGAVRMPSQAQSLVIKNGTVLLPSGKLEACDVRLEGGCIAAIGQGLAADEQVNAAGAYVVPG